MILSKFEKQPFDVKDYDIDYTEWLATSGDTLDVVTTTVACLTDPSDTSLVVDSVSITTTRAVLWISGGTHKAKYKVSVDAETVGGRHDEVELIFYVKDY